MMELLKRFEEDSAKDEEAFLNDDESNEENDELASQLEAMDLGTQNDFPTAGTF
jgi:hypothetical protein